MSQVRTYTKSPSAILDYQVDWTAWIGSDTISSVCWVVPAGLTQVSTASTSACASIFLSGGSASALYAVTNKISTAGSRTNDRTFFVQVRDTSEI